MLFLAERLKVRAEPSRMCTREHLHVVEDVEQQSTSIVQSMLRSTRSHECVRGFYGIKLEFL